MSRYTDTAADFVAEIEAHPVLDRIEARADLVAIIGRFPPRDERAFVTCEATAPSILDMLPRAHPGSVWGTVGRTLGGHRGLAGGYYRLTKSGVNRRYVNAVAKAAREKGMLL